MRADPAARSRASGPTGRKAEVDFTDLDLFAIIGDTGAGKSTILEALTFALYARKTWAGGFARRA